MLKPPVVSGAYPVTAFIDWFGFHIIVSVEATPVAETVTTVAHACDPIAVVPSVAVPWAMFCVIVADALGKVYVEESVPASVIVLLTVKLLELVPPAIEKPVASAVCVSPS